MRKLIVFLNLALAFFATFPLKATQDYKEINKVEPVQSRVTSAPIEFQYSQEELKAMEHWQDKTINKMMSDALNGDAAALYMLGMCQLYGIGGFPINLEQAKQCFSTSALLGFAPAIDKVKGFYIDDINNPNPFLILVYLNLTASFGHSEFTMPYHDRRKCVVEKFGDAMAKEIERIATAKITKIYDTMNQMEKSEDRVKMTLMLFVEEGIIGEDAQFDADYWRKFYLK